MSESSPKPPSLGEKFLYMHLPILDILTSRFRQKMINNLKPKLDELKLDIEAARYYTDDGTYDSRFAADGDRLERLNNNFKSIQARIRFLQR